MENINEKVKPAAKKSIVEIKKRAKLWFEPDSSINIRFLSTYFRDEVDILAAKVIQTKDEKQLKYGNLSNYK